MSEGKEIQNWSDKAMFEAVPTNTGSEPVEPSVKLISMTPDPLGVIAAAAKMYEGQPVKSPYRISAYAEQEVTDEDRLHYFEQFKNTRLKAPFEFVSIHFLIEGVTRAFTHQLVRQRTAVYVQESQRFAVKTNGAHEVALPPSLLGTEPWDGSITLANGRGEDMVGEFTRDDKQQMMRDVWDQQVARTATAYNMLVNMGMPAEDARGLLPTNITTRIHYKTDLRNLLEHAGNRLCSQAQFEWKKVEIGIVKAIRESGVYMADKLADLFRPICYATGKCEFMSEFDRHCSIRERVEANHMAGRPSSEWGGRMMADGDTPIDPRWQDVDKTMKTGVLIEAIRPEEWLADPSAARRSV
jgi:flavin-dependent thymidylate synthase